MKLNELNTTSYRITLSVTTACIVIMTLMIAMLFFGWGPDEKQKWVLIGIAGGLLTMMGYDVAQFIGKRWSNIDFASAKNPSPVQVEAPSNVTVTGGTKAVPTEVAVTDPDKREPSVVPGQGD